MTEDIARVDSRAAAKRYAILAYGSFGTMLDVGLMVIGSLLVGLAVSVVLAGFDIVNVVQDLSTGAMLASSLVLAVIGLFCLGVAAEGPLGRGRRLVGFKLWEIGLGRIVAVFVVGLLFLLVHNLVDGAVEGLPSPVTTGVAGIRAVGVAGMTVMPLLGVPIALAARWYPDGPDWLRSTEIPIMFVVWTVATMAIVA
ncbi:MAG TPA: hypothetical protein VFU96_03180 [Acidimicrobiia bacterium]|nr:hypothetical protein [Acidimicrobiia bacterium]